VRAHLSFEPGDDGHSSDDPWLCGPSARGRGFLDVGPNFGAINRAALLASDNLLVPLAADLFALQGLRNLGPTCGSGDRPGDGALGSTGRLVQTCFREFEGLAFQVMEPADITLPVPS
jgi:hypothetical protein